MTDRECRTRGCNVARIIVVFSRNILTCSAGGIKLARVLFFEDIILTPYESLSSWREMQGAVAVYCASSMGINPAYEASAKCMRLINHSIPH